MPRSLNRRACEAKRLAYLLPFLAGDNIWIETLRASFLCRWVKTIDSRRTLWGIGKRSL